MTLSPCGLDLYHDSLTILLVLRAEITPCICSEYPQCLAQHRHIAVSQSWLLRASYYQEWRTKSSAELHRNQNSTEKFLFHHFSLSIFLAPSHHKFPQTWSLNHPQPLFQIIPPNSLFHEVLMAPNALWFFPVYTKQYVSYSNKQQNKDATGNQVINCYQCPLIPIHLFPIILFCAYFLLT